VCGPRCNAERPGCTEIEDDPWTHAPPFPRGEGKPPVPTLAFWSRRDGIVAPSAARGQEHEIDRAVEIDTYHVGAVLWRPALGRIVREIEGFLADSETGLKPAKA